MFRNGWDNSVKSADAIPLLENGSKARTAEAGGSEVVTMPLAPLRREDAPNQELEEAWEYYHTPRCEHPNALGFATATNRDDSAIGFSFQLFLEVRKRV